MEATIPLRSQEPLLRRCKANLRSDAAAANGLTADTPSTSSVNCSLSITKRKKEKKKKAPVADCHGPHYSSSSSTTSANFSSANSFSGSSRKGIKLFGRNPKRIRLGSSTETRKSAACNKCLVWSSCKSDVDSLGLPLGMSIAAVVSQVLEKRKADSGKMSVDYLSGICTLAVKESLENVFGNKFNSFVRNFEKSFQSTLMTLRLINESSERVGEPQKPALRKVSDSVVSAPLFLDKQEDSACSSGANHGLEAFPPRISTSEQLCTSQESEGDISISLMNRQLVMHNGHTKQLACVTPDTSFSYSATDQSALSTLERSVIEQTRSNELKRVEIGLIMKKLQLKEEQLALRSDSNLLERMRLSMGFSKASFKAEKFKTQLEDTRLVELLRMCLDFLVAGLFIMLLALFYGAYVFSHRRITEATESCASYVESKSWWMPKPMSTFNSGLQTLKCQVQVLSRMFFGGLMIGSIAYLLIQRSATSKQTMPITFILLLLGVACGYAGKFCIDTLGGSGYNWLMYWETLCLLHFLSNIAPSTLFRILDGPIIVSERKLQKTLFPYWMRRSFFYGTLLLLPLLCGTMPFASPSEWIDHFKSRIMNLMEDADD